MDCFLRGELVVRRLISQILVRLAREHGGYDGLGLRGGCIVRGCSRQAMHGRGAIPRYEVCDSDAQRIEQGEGNGEKELAEYIWRCDHRGEEEDADHGVSEETNKGGVVDYSQPSEEIRYQGQLENRAETDNGCEGH